MNNFEKELKRLIVVLLQKIAYCKYNNAYSGRNYNHEISRNECALNGVVSLARNCEINIVGLQGSYCGCIVSTDDYEFSNIESDWL